MYVYCVYEGLPVSVVTSMWPGVAQQLVTGLSDNWSQVSGQQHVSGLSWPCGHSYRQALFFYPTCASEQGHVIGLGVHVCIVCRAENLNNPYMDCPQP